MLRMLAASKPFSANSVRAASRIAERVACDRCCSARFFGAARGLDRFDRAVGALVRMPQANISGGRMRFASWVGRRESEVERDGLDTIGALGLHDQGRLHAEHGVALQVLVSRQEQMRHEHAIARRADHEMYVGRPKRVTPELPQKLPCGTI